MRVGLLVAAVVTCLGAVQAQAQAPSAGPNAMKVPDTIPYGLPITLEQAKKAAAAIDAEIAKLKLPHSTFAIVEPSGELVLYEKATNGPYAAFDMSVTKAKSAARETRPTAFDQRRVLNGETWILKLSDVYPSGGAIPIVVNGHTIGAIGVTGGGDDHLAEVGAAAVAATFK